MKTPPSIKAVFSHDILFTIMILKNSLLLAIFSAISVLLGILRDKLLAVTVGVGQTLDVYNASFRVPDFVYGIFLAFITAGTVVPFLTKEDKNGHLIESEKRFVSLLFFFSVTLISVTVVLFFTLPLFAHFIVPGFSGEQLNAFIFTTRVVMIQPLVLGISSLIGCFAQLKRDFLYYAIAPLGYSLGIIFGIIFLYKGYGVNGLVYGVVLGAFLSLCIQMMSVRKNSFSLSFSNVRFKYIKELIVFAFPRSITNIVSQIRIIFFTAFATMLGPGVLSSFLFAQRVTDAMSQVVSQSVTTASLPVLSREYEEKRFKEHERLVYVYTRVLFAIAVGLSLLLFPFRDVVVSILYTNSAEGALIALFLVGFLIAFPFSMTSSYLTIGFYSMKNTTKVLFGNVVGSLTSLFVCYFFREKGIVALMLAVIVYYGVSSVIYMVLYKLSHFENGTQK
jgi:putative peptidoglycan lipid II flippase